MEENSPVNIARSARKTAIAVPESARRPKAIFWVEPSRKKVLEIIAFIRKTGTPHLHPDITYTQVQSGEIIVFLEIFDLPAEFATNEDKWCLCSACPHDYPQFKKNGILAWFPEQGIIRVVGGDC